MLHTVKFEEVKKEQLAVYRHEKNHVIEIVKGQLITRHKIESIPGDGKFFVPNEQYSKLCVVERHGKNGLVGVAPLKGFGIRGGALATTVAHDAHNIIAVGDNDRDLLVAIHALRELGGGYVIAKGGKVKDALALPICGLMSDKSAAEVRKKTTDMLDRAEQMGTQPGIDPFITLSFLALPVIPEIRLTERGLFDAVQMRFIEEK